MCVLIINSEGEGRAMKIEEGTDNSMLEMFGLTYEQSNLLFSTERMITKFDIVSTNNQEKANIKRTWLKKWEIGIKTYFESAGSDSNCGFIDVDDLPERFRKELQKSNNHTWYYILVLECMVFTPYTALGGDDDKDFKKCKYDEKRAYLCLKEFFVKQGAISDEGIERLHKTYKKSVFKITGKAEKIALGIVSVVAIAAIAATGVAIFAGPIAVAIFGSEFAGLSGAALTAACLAMAGGGAIAIGGGGMAGGIMVIAGGGALLGLAGGGAAAGLISAMVESAPEYTLTQAAKLETILKEVVLNAQQDVVTAQKIIRSLQEQIDELNKKLTELETANEKNKKEIKNIKTSIKYLKKSLKDMNVFTSSYETGLSVVEE